MTGTLAGLIWAKEHGDVAAARQILGVSLHAIEDFYSHSNWVDDPARRSLTWFDVPPAEQAKMSIWTGTYELPEQLGVKPHGKILLACSALNQSAVNVWLDPACSAISPMSGSILCQQWKACQKGENVSPILSGMRVPQGTVYLAPPGIALDNTWQADVAAQARGVTDVSGQKLFQTAYNLAARNSVQWLRILGLAMQQIEGGPAFWDQVRDAPPGDGQAQFEDFSRFPFQFLTVGPYPPAAAMGNEDLPADGYYLRVRLTTSQDSGAGTDADIKLEGAGRSFTLDYSHDANRLIEYNDFEAGDNDVYTIGPFPSLPSRIRLTNDAADTGDVLEALGDDFVAAMNELVDSAYHLLLSLIGGNADVVGSNKKVWSNAELQAIGSAAQSFSIYVDGGDEGRYNVTGSIRRVSDNDSDQFAERWATYEVVLHELQCIEESDWDQASNSDEPFVMALLVPLPGETMRYRTEPFDDVDSGESRSINKSFQVKVHRDYGGLSLPITVMESDYESGADRDDLLAEFANSADSTTGTTRSRFFDALGSAIASSWKLDHIEVFAFSRGDTIVAGTALDRNVGAWLDGDESIEFDLNTGAVRTLPVSFRDLGTAPGPVPQAYFPLIQR